MKKYSYAVHLGVLALVLTLATACLTGGTLAKYVTEVEATGSAVVAKWAVKAGDADDKSTIENFTLQDTSNSGVAAERIAPGTSGSIPIYIDLAGTEVATSVKVEIKVDNKDKLPNSFSLSAKGFGSTTDTSLSLDENDTYVTVIDVKKTAEEAETFKTSGSIEWEWPFDASSNTGANDADDTAKGTDGATADFSVRVTATQLDSDPTAPTA